MSNTVSQENIFSQGAALKDISVSINGYNISQDDLAALDFGHNFDNILINGTLLIKDSYNLYSITDFDVESKITISIVDKFDTSLTRMFNISSVNVESWDNRFRYLKFTFIDSLSYVLGNTYISKSFYDTPVNAFFEILSALDMFETYFKPTNMEFEIYDPMSDNNEKVNIVIPQDRSILDYFTYLFHIYGYRMWQDNHKLYVGRIDFTYNLNILKLEDDKEITFTNDVTNFDYQFAIYDYRILYNQFLQLNMQKPQELNFKFENGKTINPSTINFSDMYESLSSGKQNLDNSIITIGEKYTRQPMLDIYNQKLNVENIFLKNNQLEIVVQGAFKYNYVGGWVNVELKGNITDIDSTLDGDLYHSGYYLIYGLQEKIVTDKHITKIKLIRMNNKI
jgi:hypothetical protein